MKHLLRGVSKIPPREILRERLQSLAMLDAILMSDWERRFFSFDSDWGAGETMGSMRDGQGSEFFFLFDAVGVAGKIYCEGSAIGPNSATALNEIPRAFSSFLGEAAFSINLATCYLWQSHNGVTWSVAPKTVISIPLLAFVADGGEYYQAWAENHYDLKLDLSAIKCVFRLQALTIELLQKLNPECDKESVLRDAEEIDYPVDD